MNRVPVVSRPLALVFLMLLALTWAGGFPAAAAPAPNEAPSLESFLFADTDCALPSNDADGLEAKLMGTPVQCGSSCGYTGCRSVLVGSLCTKPTGGQGTCYGPPMGKTCADGHPMCLCV